MTDILDKHLPGYCETLYAVTDETTHSHRAVLKIYASSDIYVLKTFQYATTEVKDIEQARQEYEIPLNLAQGNNHIIKPLVKKELEDKAAGVLFIEMLFEYGGNNLLSLMNNLKPEELLSILRQTIDALAYLESQGVFHSDVKPQNIVIRNGIVKLIDFGVAKNFEKQTMLMKQTVHLTEKVIGQTFRYSPPEIFVKDSKYIINKIDVYSWGMTFYQLLSRKPDTTLAKEGELARENPSNYKNFMAVVQKTRIVGDSNLLVTNMILPMLVRALAFNPEDRPDFANLKLYFGLDALTAPGSSSVSSQQQAEFSKQSNCC